MKQARYSDDLSPGTWTSYKASQRLAINYTYHCPDCGNPIRIRDERIQDDGVIEGQVVCPMWQCEFDEHVTLLGWKQYG